MRILKRWNYFEYFTGNVLNKAKTLLSQSNWKSDNTLPLEFGTVINEGFN